MASTMVRGITPFQPTLLAVTRSDRTRFCHLNMQWVFQPTLLAVTRSDAGVVGWALA